MLSMDDQSFARSIHMDQSQFSKIKNDKMGITLKQVMEISSIHAVRSGWLIEGEEPILKGKSDPVKEPDNLLIQLKRQIDELKTNSDKLFERLSEQDEGTQDPDYPFVDFAKGKSQKAGKP